MRFLLLIVSIVFAGCSEVSPPPRPPLPGTPRPSMSRDDGKPAPFPPNFTIVFTREYGMWQYRTCTLEINLYVNADAAELECVTTGNRHERFRTERPGFDATRLRQLAEAADLYGSNHVGEDMTPGDGTFDTLRFRPAGGGRAVVLVTSRTTASRISRRDGISSNF